MSGSVLRAGLDINPLLYGPMTGVPMYVDALIREFVADDGARFVLVGREPQAAMRDAFAQRGLVWRDDPRLELVSDLSYVRLGAHFPALNRAPLGWVTRKVDGRVLMPTSAAAARRRIGALDVFHHTGGGAPPPAAARRFVVTLYDLTTRLFPEAHPPEEIAGFEQTFAFARDRADLVIAISEATRRDVVEHLGIAEDRVHTVPLAARVSLPRAVPEDAVRAIETKLDLTGRRFVLASGSLEPRKNLPRLIEAFGALAAEPGLDDLRLVLSGARLHGAPAIDAAIRRCGLQNKVVLTGYIADVELAVLMRRCACFAYVSLYEGFGLPLLEAMALGAPAVTSNVSSLPEVAGDAAVLVDPCCVEAIAGGLRRVVTDPGLADALRAKGIARAQTFSWERTAAEHLRLYREASR